MKKIKVVLVACCFVLTLTVLTTTTAVNPQTSSTSNTAMSVSSTVPQYTAQKVIPQAQQSAVIQNSELSNVSDINVCTDGTTVNTNGTYASTAGLTTIQSGYCYNTANNNIRVKYKVDANMRAIQTVKKEAVFRSYCNSSASIEKHTLAYAYRYKMPISGYLIG